MSDTKAQETIHEIAREIAVNVEDAIDVRHTTERVVMRRLDEALGAAREILFREVVTVVREHECRDASCECSREIAIELERQRLEGGHRLFLLWEQMR